MQIVQPSARLVGPGLPTDPFTREDGIALLRRCEYFGRISHRSEEAQTADSWEPFISKVVMGHGDWCYDEETEVLTDSGWKWWKDVTEHDQFATLNSCGHIEYHHPLRLVKSYYIGQMYAVRGRNVNLLVTPNHSLYVCKTTTKEGRKKQDFSLVRARELGHVSHAYQKTGVNVAPDFLTYSEAQFIGFAIGDAHINVNPARGSTVRFELKKDRKKQYLRQICMDAGLPLREQASLKEGCTRFSISAQNRLMPYLRDIYDARGEKQIPRTLLFAGQQTCLGLLHGLLAADGHTTKKGTTAFGTTSASIAATFQQLCLHAGVAADLTYVLPAQRRWTFPNSKPFYRFEVLSARYLKPEVNKCASAPGKSEWITWSGNVYCAEVPNHTLYVRRHGKAVWSGNSIIEHASVSVDFLVDRGVTHELVRHRLFSVTQESTRFVRYGVKRDLCFVQPAGLDPDGIRAWTVAMEEAETAYDVLLESGQPPQIARSALPNALASRLAMTGNLRNWRHLFLMRTTKESHPQMRQVTIPLLEEFRHKLPILYEDIEPLAKQSDNLKKMR